MPANACKCLPKVPTIFFSYIAVLNIYSLKAAITTSPPSKIHLNELITVIICEAKSANTGNLINQCQLMWETGLVSVDLKNFWKRVRNETCSGIKIVKKVLKNIIICVTLG